MYNLFFRKVERTGCAFPILSQIIPRRDTTPTKKVLVNYFCDSVACQKHLSVPWVNVLEIDNYI